MWDDGFAVSAFQVAVDVYAVTVVMDKSFVTLEVKGWDYELGFMNGVRQAQSNCDSQD